MSERGKRIACLGMVASASACNSAVSGFRYAVLILF